MVDERLTTMAHLLRRAGFGSSRDELEVYAARPYEEVVDDLVNPERFEPLDEDTLERFYPHIFSNKDNPAVWNGRWFWRMVNTRRPLEEKMTLFWHHVFATGWTKSEHTPSMVAHIEMLRKNGLQNFRTLLLEISKDPAMSFWLDNSENHGDAPNENYGRELLELFSMGIGTYNEPDVKDAARAFTGWTFEQPLPLYPTGHYNAKFQFRPEDHDNTEKTFLGVTGNLDGEDIIDLIVKQEANARFICRHIYNFFVADEPQIPAWSVTPPHDEAAIDTLVKAYMDSDADIRTVMKTLFLSDFFKEARGKRVKCPAEFIAGTIKLTGEFREIEPGLPTLDAASVVMGQKLMDPPTVEGWHTGKEWIDGGTLTERINFATARVGNPEMPGTRAIIDRLSGHGDPITPAELVDGVLDLAGPIEVADETRTALLQLAELDGDLEFGSPSERTKSEDRIARMLALAVASREYQFA